MGAPKNNILGGPVSNCWQIGLFHLKSTLPLWKILEFQPKSVCWVIPDPNNVQKNYVKKVWTILEFQPKSTVKTFQIQPKFMKKVLKNSKFWQFAVNL